MRFHLVCMGAGLAGLVCALRASELGLRVALVEAGTGEHYACNSRITGGFLHVAYQDVTVSPEDLRAHMAGVAMDNVLASTVADHAGRSLQWLRSRGVRLARFPPRPGAMKYRSWVMVPPRPLMTGVTHEAAWKGRGPDLGLRELKKRFVALGGQFFDGTRGQRLIMRDGRCRGLQAVTADDRVIFDAEAVVLSDGGFSGNPALFRRYIGPQPAKVLQRGAGTGRGDALLMAMEAGAALAEHPNRFYGHVLSQDAFRNNALWPYPQLDPIVASGVVVDRNGQRILDEGLGGIHAANCIAGLTDPACATVIFDAAIWEGAGRIGHVAPNPWLLRHGATLHMAENLRELARACSLPAEALVATVNAYNAARDRGELAKLSPARSERKGTAMPIVRPPFMAAPVCPGITHTMGGLSVTADAQLRNSQGQPMSGLYAAGATLGGLEGGPTVGYVGGLVKAAVFGIRAAEHVAASRREQ